MIRRTFAFRSVAALLLVWVGLVAVFAMLMIRSNLSRADAEVEAEGVALHRLLSQRVAQHDAHLTSLAALVQASDPPPAETVRQVATGIMRYYRRILSIRVLEMTPDQVIETLVAVPAEMEGTVMPRFAQLVFGQRAGEARYYVEADHPEHYFLGKRAGSDRRLAIILEIDPNGLLTPEERLSSDRISLSLGPYALTGRPPVAEPGAFATLTFFRPADSTTQPVNLGIERPVSFYRAVAPVPVAAFALFSLLALFAGRYTLIQRHEARHSQQLAALAEERSRLLERETQLAHAARVNSLGELASGIAHELTQPLTALLSQSQAALRLSGPEGDPVRLSEALDANVREARRAGEILRRMRDYIARRASERTAVDISDVVDDAATLARADLARRGIALELDLERPMPLANADPVELEQVLHNLIRNAADSLEERDGPDKRILIRTFDAGETVAIRVSDTGKGISADVLPRLFEPFFTTKSEGMGLGLSLCATLVERASGTIEAEARPGEGASFLISLPALAERRLAAQ
ncbi:sensor histidine kinase [Xanthobacter aminoxidans]|uniref:sensor histidine kinase n=1 Tax=Xanthobacter aminoxidans TaxID=186280 RepID=UPI002022EA92|nr:ATP-binding protein [Xanthobacter aminoxidans]